MMWRMSDPLSDYLAHVQQLQPYLELNLSEADTRVYLIDPVLRALGYVSVGDIRREVPVPATKEFLDYELYADGRAQAIVEAKALRNQITDQAAAQCVQYAAVLGVRWCIITNGITWSVYNAHATGPLSDKKVASVRLDGDEPSLLDAWEVLSLFARESLAQSNPLTRLLAERVIIDELARPDSAAITALRKAVKDRFGERVTAQAVIAVIDKMRGRQVKPESAIQASVSKTPDPAQALSGEASTPPADAVERQRHVVLKPDGSRVTLEDMLAAGVLPSDAALEFRGRGGVSYVARLRDNRVEMGGQMYESISDAAKAASGANRNGWYFWHYQGEELSEIRRRFADKLAADAQRGTA